MKYNRHMTSFLIRQDLWDRIKKKAERNDLSNALLINILLRNMFKDGIFPYAREHYVVSFTKHFKLGSKYCAKRFTMVDAFLLRMEIDLDIWSLLELFLEVNGISMGLGLDYILRKALDKKIRFS